MSGCDATPGQQLEHYYSFHHILDAATPGWERVEVALAGDGEASSPSGQVGNDRLEHISYGNMLVMAGRQ